MRRVQAVKTASGVVKSMKVGSRVWTPARDIASTYGIGPGKVAIHLDTVGATLNGAGKVSGLSNRGGAGAMFDAAQTGTGDGFALDGNTIRYTGQPYNLKLATQADLRNVRMMAVLNWDSVLTNSRFVGATAPDGSRYEVVFLIGSDQRTMVRYNKIPAGGSTIVLQSGWLPAMPKPGLFLLETELTDATFRVFVNGAQVASVATTADFIGVPYLIDNIGGGAALSTAGVIANVGDILGVTTGAGSDQSITIARRHVANRFSIAVAP